MDLFNIVGIAFMRLLHKIYQPNVSERLSINDTHLHIYKKFCAMMRRQTDGKAQRAAASGLFLCVRCLSGSLWNIRIHEGMWTQKERTNIMLCR